jgi:hypothetical protein
MRKGELELLELGLSLYDGESKAGQVCPQCKGGRTNESSFSLSRDGSNVYYKCHRASCSFSGRIRVSGQAAREYRETKRAYRTYVTDPDPLPEAARQLLRDKYYLLDEELSRFGIGWTTAHSPKRGGGEEAETDAGRVYFPMYRRDGTVRGYSARDLTGQYKPKVLTFQWRSEDTRLGWYTNRASEKVMLVEDSLSAMRAAQYMNACALSGVHIAEDALDELLRSGFTEAYLALDKDATSAAVRLALRYRGKFRLIPVPLPKDLKNMTRPELDEFIKELL